jgi:hypothetical protein
LGLPLLGRGRGRDPGRGAAGSRVGDPVMDRAPSAALQGGSRRRPDGSSMTADGARGFRCPVCPSFPLVAEAEKVRAAPRPGLSIQETENVAGGNENNPVVGRSAMVEFLGRQKLES